MIEIIVLYFLIKKIRKILIAKGIKPGKYIATLLLLWFSLEILFLGLGIKLLGEPLSAFFFAIIGAAIGGYLGYKLAVNADPEPTSNDQV